MGAAFTPRARVLACHLGRGQPLCLNDAWRVLGFGHGCTVPLILLLHLMKLGSLLLCQVDLLVRVSLLLLNDGRLKQVLLLALRV